MIDESIAESLPVQPGMLIGGKYRIEKLLAAGGMGAVVIAQHEVLDQPVAIKLMLPAMLEIEQAAERFMREARATARIRSDFVARILDVDQLDDGTPFMVMELLRGQPLDELIAGDEELSVSEAVDMVMEALAGLCAAHGAGVVHRDLKPSNLFVTTRSNGRRRIKLLDFGISKVVANDDLSKPGALTGTKQILGSPQYMSPEQITSSKDADARSDLWSIGTILFELLVGTPTFDGDNVGAVLAQILTEDPPRVDVLRPEIEPSLGDVVEKALAKNKDDRFPSAEVMMRALGDHASGRARDSLLASLPPPATVPSPGDPPRVVISPPSAVPSIGVESARSKDPTQLTAVKETSAARTLAARDSPHTLLEGQQPVAAEPGRKWVSAVLVALATSIIVGGSGIWMVSQSKDDPLPPQTQSASQLPRPKSTSSTPSSAQPASSASVPPPAASSVAPAPSPSSDTAASASAAATPPPALPRWPTKSPPPTVTPDPQPDPAPPNPTPAPDPDQEPDHLKSRD